VEVAEARRVLSGRIKAGPAQWRTLTLFVVQDFAAIRVSKLMPQAGAWPPKPGEILIERDALQVAHARIGDEVTVRTARGLDHALRISGTVKDVGQAQARMENLVYGYVTLQTLALLGEAPVLDRLYLQGGDALQVKAVLEARGHPVTRVDLPEPGKHPHADLMGLLLLVLASFALFALVLSGALVMNLMTALMASQVRQIGVMKAIGGSRARIARIYLGQALLLGAVAVLIGLGPGVLGGRAIVQAMAVFLNFDIGSFAVPAWVFAVAALLGLLAPLLSAAWPVWRGTAVPVCEALTSHGVSQNNFGADALDRALAGVGGLARPVLLALRNAFRRRTRVLLTLGTLSLGGLFFMTALNVRASMIGTLDGLFAKMKFDLSVTLAGTGTAEQVERAMRAVPEVQGFEAWMTTQGSLPGPGETHAAGLHGGGGGAPAGSFPVFALPPATRMLDFDISRGRGLQPGDTNALVISSALAAQHRELQPGQTVTLRLGHMPKEFQVVGIARQPFSPPAAYIPREAIEMPGMTNSLRIAVRGDVEVARAAVDKALEAEGLRAMTSNSKADSRTGFDEHMRMIYVALVILSAILGGVGGLGLATTMSLNVLERRRELGVLRALGATPATVWLLVVAEGAVIGLASWGVAALLAWPVSKLIGRGLVIHAFHSSMDFVFEPRGVGIGLLLSLLLAVLGSFAPAVRATRDTIREALAYE
ncbi:MAG TPA: FtsX-like permease family protein, partial [Myxococcales bacterium]|nr:FtsX-like permease family protein [Myxococcales bacterium]